MLDPIIYSCVCTRVHAYMLVCVCVNTWVCTTYLNTGVNVEEIEHVLHVNECLPHISIHRSEEIQRNWKLKQQAIHHHQVSNSHWAYSCEQDTCKFLPVWISTQKVYEYTEFSKKKRKKRRAPPVGLEPTTFELEVQCANPLRHGGYLVKLTVLLPIRTQSALWIWLQKFMTLGNW